MCPGVVTVKNADPRAPVSVGVTNLHHATFGKWVTELSPSPSSLLAVVCAVPKTRCTGTRCYAYLAIDSVPR